MRRLLSFSGGLLLGLCANLLHASPQVDSGHWDNSYDAHFQRFSKRYFGPHFDWRWFKAQAIAESHLRPGVTSPAGARGLMQLLPSTFGDIRSEQPHIDDLDSAQANIAAGIYYDSKLFRKWSGLPQRERIYLTLASYNAGYYRVRRAYNKVEGSERSWQRIKAHLPAETRAYVARISQLMDEQQQAPRMLRLAHLFAAAD